jgi:uncharacterized membrane protein YphA (DoxX/SURF4 family)
MRRRQLLVTIVRTLVGVMMVVIGVMKFVKPSFKASDDGTLQSFIDTGWLWQLIGAAEAIGGLALVSGWFVPLGLAVLTPVVAGILAFALKYGGEETSVGILLAAVHLWLCWKYRDSFRSLFTKRNPESVGKLEPVATAN